MHLHNILISSTTITLNIGHCVFSYQVGVFRNTLQFTATGLLDFIYQVYAIMYLFTLISSEIACLCFSFVSDFLGLFAVCTFLECPWTFCSSWILQIPRMFKVKENRWVITASIFQMENSQAKRERLHGYMDYIIRIKFEKNKLIENLREQIITFGVTFTSSEMVWDTDAFRHYYLTAMLSSSLRVNWYSKWGK